MLRTGGDHMNIYRHGNSNTINPRIASIVLVFLVSALALTCSDDALNKEQRQIEEFNKAVGEYVETAAVARTAMIEVAQIGSREFTIAPGSESPPSYTAQETEAFAGALVEMSTGISKLVAQSHNLLQASDPLVIRDLIDKNAGPGAPSAGKQPRFLLTGVVALGLGAAACYGLFKINDEVSDKWSAPAKKRIDNMSDGSAEHKVINESLGLDENTSKEETVKKFEDLDAAQRAQASNGIDVDLALGSTNSGDIKPIDSEEKSRAIIDATTTAGEGLVKLEVSLLTGVTGALTGGKVLEWATGSESIGVYTDLLITVVTEATGVSIQPLDVFADKVNIVVTKKTTETVKVDRPTTTIAPEDAGEVLKDEKTTGPQKKDAAASIALEAADKYPEALRPISNSDGSVDIQSPERTFLGDYEDPSSETTVQLPSLGPSNMVVVVDGKVPMSFDDVDLGGDGPVGIDFEDQDIEDFGEGDDDQSGLTVTADNQSPGPGEEVTIYIDCPARTVFPITLDAPSPQSASLAWSSPIGKCPFMVLFSADVEGAYDLDFAVTDAEAVTYSGSTTINVGPGIDTDTETGADGDADADADTDSTASVWCDSSSGLCWQGDSKETDPMDNGSSLTTATEYCDKLTLDGNTDWRLPTIQELISLIRGCGSSACGASDPDCLEITCGEACESCGLFEGPGKGTWLEGCYWPNEIIGSCNGSYWSSSRVPPDPDNPLAQEKVWLVQFSTGGVGASILAFKSYTRCVR